MKYDLTNLEELINNIEPEGIANNIDDAIFMIIDTDGSYRLDDISALIGELRMIRNAFRNIKPFSHE